MGLAENVFAWWSLVLAVL